ncbi:MAG: NAD(+)/NADH kinase [Firmicutes bacterium]|nr:NAD(+)/NADH kinase [Bacillota bacterium]
MKDNMLIYCSDTEASLRTSEALIPTLRSAGITISPSLTDDVDLIVCIGGGGTFLEAIHHFDFPEVPFIGINTGHLGFFQEMMPDMLDDFITNYREEKYSLQPMHTVQALVTSGGRTDEYVGLNEVIICSASTHSVHLNISIGGSFIERFSGDGVLIATPAGSTAYNYSLGGSIVDPRLRLLQVTPMAPMNTTAYRSFTSSIVLPPDLSIGIHPDGKGSKGKIRISVDGFEYLYDELESVDVRLSEKVINLLRFESYDFWSKVKSKFL